MAFHCNNDTTSHDCKRAAIEDEYNPGRWRKKRVSPLFLHPSWLHYLGKSKETLNEWAHRIGLIEHYYLISPFEFRTFPFSINFIFCCVHYSYYLDVIFWQINFTYFDVTCEGNHVFDNKLWTISNLGRRIDSPGSHRRGNQISWDNHALSCVNI